MSCVSTTPFSMSQMVHVVSMEDVPSLLGSSCADTQVGFGLVLFVFRGGRTRRLSGAGWGRGSRAPPLARTRSRGGGQHEKGKAGDGKRNGERDEGSGAKGRGERTSFQSNEVSGAQNSEFLLLLSKLRSTTPSPSRTSQTCLVGVGNDYGPPGTARAGARGRRPLPTRAAGFLQPTSPYFYRATRTLK